MARGQGHRRKCSQKERKRSSKFFFRRKRFQKIFSGDLQLRKTNKGLRKFSARFLAFSYKISTIQKIVLFSSRGQGNFRGSEASRPRSRTSPLRPRPRTSKCVLKAKDVLEDSISDTNSIIVQMPIVLNKFLHHIIKIKKPSFRKNLDIFRKT